MRVIETIKTKSKWCLPVKDGVGCTGYCDHPHGYEFREEILGLPPGENQIIEGALYLTGVSRGRSSVEFTFVEDGGKLFVMSPKYVEDLFESVAYGRMEIQAEEVGVRFRGRWTFGKSGTQISLVPL